MSLCLPAIGRYRVLDDWVLELSLRGQTLPGLANGLFGMFRFASGHAAQNRELVERGLLLPWWSDPELRVAFLRPLSGLTHALDLACWPASPPLMFAHSLVWLGLTIAAALGLYRRLEKAPGHALSAMLLFSIIPAYGAAVGWLSSRNTLIASLFGILTVWSWIDGARTRALVCLVAALLSGEVGVCALAYVVSYSLILDPRPTRARLVSLVPIALVTLIWRAVHVGFGFGARASGAYLDPLRDFAAFAAALPERLVVSLGAVLGPIPADLVFVGEPEKASFCVALALAVSIAFGSAIRRVLNADPVARFWACGSLLAALPLCAAPPNDRGLLLVAIGAKALVVRLAPRLRTPGAGRVLAAGFIAWHALGAPVLLAVRSGQFQALGRTLAGYDRVLDSIPELESRTVVVLNAPRDLFASYVQLERAARGVPIAGRFYWLTNASSQIQLTRVAADALEVSRQGGFCSTPLERLYRRDPTLLRPGTILDFSAIRAEIVASQSDGLPARVRFSFRVPLEHASLVFLAWRNGRYLRVAPPALGETATFERELLEGLL